MSGLLEAGIAATAAGLATAGNIAATNNLNRRNRSWQESMWNKTNAYNTPLAQKQRLEEAGINPYSALGASGADTGQTSSPATPQTYQPNFEALGNAGENILGAIQMAKQNELLDQQKEQGNINLEFARIKAMQEIENMRAQNRKMLAEANLSNEERTKIEKENSLLDEQFSDLVRMQFYQANITQTTSENLQREYDDKHRVSEVERLLAESNIKVNKKQIEVMVSQMRKIDNEIALLVSQKKLTEEQAKVETEKRYTEVANRALGKYLAGLQEGELWRKTWENDGPKGKDNDNGIIGAIVGTLLGTVITKKPTVVKGFR